MLSDTMLRRGRSAARPGLPRADRAGPSASFTRGLTPLLTSDQAFAGGLLLVWGLSCVLAHLWLAPIAPPA